MLNYDDYLLFNSHSINNDSADSFRGRLGLQLRVEKTGKVTMESFVSADQLVGESQAWHQSTLLYPKDRGKRSRKENPFNSSKSDNSFTKCSFFWPSPFQRPISFLLDTWHWIKRGKLPLSNNLQDEVHELTSLHGIEKEVFLFGVPYVRIDEETVHFRVDIFNCNLKPVEAASLSHLNLWTKSFHKVLIHNPVTCSKECQHMLDKVLFFTLYYSNWMHTHTH